MIKHTEQARILYLAAAIGFVVFLMGIGIAVYSPVRTKVTQQLANKATVVIQRPALFWSIGSTACETLGAAILFPVLISFAYDHLREKLLGDEVWRLFGELADAGITRVYKDREFAEGRDNAQTRLSQEFQKFDKGEICFMGPTLRVFFNVLGPFHNDISTMLRRGHGDVRVRALIEHDDSPCVADRISVEEPHLRPDEQPQTQRDASATVAEIRTMNAQIGEYVTLRRFMPAPYCTAIIFPHVAYFSPNLLAPSVPVRLPMILFRSSSHAYRMILASFSYLWDSNHTIQAVPDKDASLQGVPVNGNANDAS